MDIWMLRFLQENLDDHGTFFDREPTSGLQALEESAEIVGIDEVQLISLLDVTPYGTRASIEADRGPFVSKLSKDVIWFHSREFAKCDSLVRTEQSAQSNAQKPRRIMVGT